MSDTRNHCERCNLPAPGGVTFQVRDHDQDPWRHWCGPCLVTEVMRLRAEVVELDELQCEHG